MKQYNKNGKYSKTFINFMHSMCKRYIASNYTELKQVYKKPSQAKINAMERIRQKAESTPHIIGYNNWNFSVAYFVSEDELRYFVVDTSYNTYVILDMYI